jgi:hypothetical protein
MNVIRRIIVQALLVAITCVACVPSFAQSGKQDSNLRSSDMSTFVAPVVVEFPLRGEWMAPNTPGKQIPSHGTDQLAETYAYDFLQVDWSRTGHPFYDASVLEYLFHGVPLNRCYGWGKEVYAPCDGRIIQARDGYPERQTVNLFSDLRVAFNNARTFDLRTNDLQAVAGNYVIMSCDNTDIYAAFAHLQQGSIAVSAGSVINKGQIIGKIGHSGNSTAPHLHFQLMDSPDMNTARGVPCAFERYEVLQDNQWQLVTNAIPSDKDRIRFNK